MAGLVLHVGADVRCEHGGRVTADTPNPRVRVQGRPVVVMGNSWMVTDCQNEAGACETAEFTTGSVRLRSMGRPLLLSSSTAVCSPNGSGVRIDGVQLRVRGE